MSSNTNRKIVVYGRGYQPRFFEFVGTLTGKQRPRLCYLPTAMGDNEQSIINWYEACTKFNVKPFYQKMFISSYDQQETFEEVLLSMDGIVVGGGNTLNMMAIWRAQGVDVILKKAWDQGIVLAGGSAGSLCWFEEGTTDSRPKQLSKVEGLGFIKGSHCPHYDAEPGRRPLYHRYIKEGVLKAGYAVDNNAAIYFEDNEVRKVVTLDENSNAYFVSLKNGEVLEERLGKEMLE